MHRLWFDPGQPLLCVYLIHHEQVGRTASQEGDAALRQGSREVGSPSLGIASTGHMKPEPPYFKQGLL